MLLPISYFLNDDALVFIINLNKNIKANGINITIFLQLKLEKFRLKKIKF